MSTAPGPAPASGLARLARPVQWGLLLVASAALAAILEWFGLPAALLMGPMLSGIAFGLSGATIRLAKPSVIVAQALIGTMIAGAITGNILVTFLGNWPLFLAIIVAVIAMSTLSGWAISRLNILPGTTAIWGCSAGAAGTMMLMAEAYGADARLVAFMQYLRVLFVAGCAALVAHYWVGLSGREPAPIDFFNPVEPLAFAETIVMMVATTALGLALKLPAGGVMAPFIIGGILNATGVITVALPNWLLTIGYALLGWNIGLGFNRAIVAHARRALLPTVLSIVVLIGLSGLLAALLSKLAGIDPLTAYLATSPGGMDSIAIIAASSDVDVPFVMALQTARLILVTLIGPALARMMANRTQPPDG
ncbi:ammonia monooxygenase [Rhizobium rhizosphaerae]|uniref:Ammonia monooxygenase n=1 Tax=Xaviernesmea rhizosphaerae TaxID=1672749 RepID=A0ABX3PI64_9HYPH|nr:AbrB family transcriptional regulator [Xaviernesmea rhizosphaerae]OQP87877.1 ammonia monooxygenase [Xaviernesmea rhizosphaerae]